MRGKARTRRIDLGLAMLETRAKRGEALTLEDIAAWCECTSDTIHLIEKRARRKLANRLQFGAERTLGREVAA